MESKITQKEANLFVIGIAIGLVCGMVAAAIIFVGIPNLIG